MEEFDELTPGEQFMIKRAVAGVLKIKEFKRKVIVDHNTRIKRVEITLIGNDVAKYRQIPKLKKWLKEEYGVKSLPGKVSYPKDTPPDQKRYMVSIPIKVAERIQVDAYNQKKEKKNGL